MIAVIDYDAGNMKSVIKALHFLEKEYICTNDCEEILKADHVILPGVGAFGTAMEQIRSHGVEEVIHDVVNKGTPFLGVCLGMQVLFNESEENSGVKGLSLLDGKIKKIPVGEYEKVPHMGWNSLELKEGSRLFKGIENNPYVYFVHSYYLEAKNPEVVCATTNYNTLIHAAVEKDNLFGCQFHPEKSSTVGLQILKNFVEL